MSYVNINSFPLIIDPQSCNIYRETREISSQISPLVEVSEAGYHCELLNIIKCVNIEIVYIDSGLTPFPFVSCRISQSAAGLAHPSPVLPDHQVTSSAAGYAGGFARPSKPTRQSSV